MEQTKQDKVISVRVLIDNPPCSIEGHPNRIQALLGLIPLDKLRNMGIRWPKCKSCGCIAQSHNQDGSMNSPVRCEGYS